MRISKTIMKIIAVAAAFILIPQTAVYAVDTTPTEEYASQWEGRKSLPVQSNTIAGWPKGPENGCESAILMDVETGAIL